MRHGQTEARDLCRGRGRRRAARCSPVPDRMAMARRCWSGAMRRCWKSCTRWALPIPKAMKSTIACPARWCPRWSTGCICGCNGAAICAAMCSAWSIGIATSLARLMLAMDQGDAMITGITRTFAQTMRELRRVLDHEKGRDPLWHPRAGRQDAYRVHGRYHGQRTAQCRGTGLYC